MRKGIITILIVLFIFGTASGSVTSAKALSGVPRMHTASILKRYVSQSGNTTAQSQQQSAAVGPCDPSRMNYLWDHTYENGRLPNKNECITVSGTVEDDPHTIPDGDGKFIIQLSTRDAHYSTKENCKNHDPKCDLLLVEIVCHDPTKINSKYPKAAEACKNYTSNVTIPKYN